jgi:hypothetical protein
MTRASGFQEKALGATEGVAARPPMRANPKDESPRDRANRRAEELRQHLGNLDEGTDEFYVPAQMIPDGWTYEWKRQSVYNQEEQSYIVQTIREGWEPVPVDRCPMHRAMMPSTWTKGTIERKGMMLMERPTEITEEMRAIELRRARQQVRVKEQQLSATPDGTMSRDDPRVAPKIKKGYSPVDIPD